MAEGIRPCDPYIHRSDNAEILNCQEKLDESGELSDMIGLASAYIRADFPEYIRKGLQLLKAASHGATGTIEDQTKIDMLTIIALYRLKEDEQCLQMIRCSRDRRTETPISQEIECFIYKLRKDKEKKELAIEVGVSVGIGVAALAGGIFALMRRK